MMIHPAGEQKTDTTMNNYRNNLDSGITWVI